jgi:hypothetical protein
MFCSILLCNRIYFCSGITATAPAFDWPSFAPPPLFHTHTHTTTTTTLPFSL